MKKDENDKIAISRQMCQFLHQHLIQYSNDADKINLYEYL